MTGFGCAQAAGELLAIASEREEKRVEIFVHTYRYQVPVHMRRVFFMLIQDDVMIFREVEFGI